MADEITLAGTTSDHRFRALEPTQFATVARLATPEREASRFIDLPGESIVALW